MKKEVVETRMFKESTKVPDILKTIYSEEVESSKLNNFCQDIEGKSAEFENEVFEIVFDRVMEDFESYGYSRTSELTIRENNVYKWVFGDRFNGYDFSVKNIVATEKYIISIVHESFKKLGGRDIEELEEEILEIRLKKELV